MTKHKHYYAIRAFADGWKIEIDYGDEIWVPTDNPRFSKSYKYRVVPDENGWLPWYGGEYPVDGTALVDVRLFNGEQENEIALARDYRWVHNNNQYDIVAYRVVKKAVADPYAELKAAAEDPNKEIAIRGHEVTLGWHSGKYWKFDRPVEDYVVRDKPKKIKLLAWVEANGNLNWRKEGYEYGPYWARIWKRVPSEDKEIEVEE